jgi:hypothetical protein
VHRPAPRVVVVGERAGSLLDRDLVETVCVEDPARDLGPRSCPLATVTRGSSQRSTCTLCWPRAEHQRDDETRDPEHGRDRIRHPSGGPARGRPSRVFGFLTAPLFTGDWHDRRRPAGPPCSSSLSDYLAHALRPAARRTVVEIAGLERRAKVGREPPRAA